VLHRRHGHPADALALVQHAHAYSIVVTPLSALKADPPEICKVRPGEIAPAATACRSTHADQPGIFEVSTIAGEISCQHSNSANLICVMFIVSQPRTAGAEIFHAKDFQTFGPIVRRAASCRPMTGCSSQAATGRPGRLRHR
jgi:hypothetical protein